jgi:hypothetical protein
LPGLTRQSIVLEKPFLRRLMDARVKPAHDASRWVQRDRPNGPLVKSFKITHNLRRAPSSGLYLFLGTVSL